MPINQNIRFLLDTNIGIQLEELDSGTGEIRSSFKHFAELSHKYGIKLFHHPDSHLDIQNDADQDRQKATRSRFEKYPALKAVPHGEGGELEELFTAINGPNDLVDCQMLYALHRDCIEYLISEDAGLHRRARYSGLNERVFTIDEAITFLQKYFGEESFVYPNTQKIFLSEVRIEDTFFDSLKEDYPKFPAWFKGMQDKGEVCWTIEANDQIAAICIIENKGFGKLPYRANKKTLKACTFKVSDDFRGSKYGELLLKNLFTHCVQQDYDLVYLTTHRKQSVLMYFLKDFGFQLGPRPKSNGELEYFKTFYPPPANHPRVDPVEFHKIWSPYFYDDKNIQKYVIPIQPKYHDILFPEIRLETLMFEDTSKVPPGNTIKKAYLCHSPTKVLERGSIILFYRSSPSQTLTTLGIVEETKRFTDLPSLLKMVGKRSVYSVQEIREMLKKDVMVIKLPHPVNLWVHSGVGKSPNA